MYYDLEIHLTQGWATYARDLADELDAILELHWLQARGHTARIVRHCATV